MYFLYELCIDTTIDSTREILWPLHIVRTQYNGGIVLAAYLIEKGEDEFTVICIEVACRLICQDDFWVVEDGTGYADALLLTARQFEDELVYLVLQLHHLKHLFDALRAFRLMLPSCRAEHEIEIAMYSAVRQKLEVLKDNAHLPTEGWLMLCLKAYHIKAQHFCFRSLDRHFAIEALE